VAAGLVAAWAGVVLAADGDVGDVGCGGRPDVDVIFLSFSEKFVSHPDFVTTHPGKYFTIA
jgi:hypothetical protein